MTKTPSAPEIVGEAPLVPDSDFYVGYLRMPAQLARLLRWCVPSLIVAALALGWYVSGSQNDPGPGVWHNDVQTLVGRISATPYPLIRLLSNEPGRPIETVLLVSEGKHGAGERVAALNGRIAKVRGAILERDGRRLMELADGNAVTPDDSFPAADATRLTVSTTNANGASRSRVTLRGEIIDPKCYSGAMKPGEGKAHKECATLCIAGGIPPMFVTVDDSGRRRYYLLTSTDGGPLDGRILPFVADAVEIGGVLERRDDLEVFRIDPGSIRRL